MNAANVGPNFAFRAFKPLFLYRKRTELVSDHFRTPHDCKTYLYNGLMSVAAAVLVALAVEDPGIFAQELRTALRLLKQLREEGIHVDPYAVGEAFANLSACNIKKR